MAKANKVKPIEATKAKANKAKAKQGQILQSHGHRGSRPPMPQASKAKAIKYNATKAEAIKVKAILGQSTRPTRPPVHTKATMAKATGAHQGHHSQGRHG